MESQKGVRVQHHFFAAEPFTTFELLFDGDLLVLADLELGLREGVDCADEGLESGAASASSAFAMDVISDTTEGSTRGLVSQALR